MDASRLILGRRWRWLTAIVLLVLVASPSARADRLGISLFSSPTSADLAVPEYELDFFFTHDAEPPPDYGPETVYVFAHGPPPACGPQATECSLVVTRDGATIASGPFQQVEGAPQAEARLSVVNTLEPGDIATLMKQGAAIVSMPYDGNPSVTEPACGTNAYSGTADPGARLTAGRDDEGTAEEGTVTQTAGTYSTKFAKAGSGHSIDTVTSYSEAQSTPGVITVESDYIGGECDASPTPQPPAPTCSARGEAGTYPNCHLAFCEGSEPTASPANYQAKVESRLAAALSAKPGGAPIARWNLLHQSFGTGSWHFRWKGDGSFTIIPPSLSEVTFEYSVTDSRGCTSGATKITINGPVASFASVEPATQATPIYEALGDSFSSGEGNPSFLPGTDTKSDQCHRSSAAYGSREYYQNLLPKIPTLHFLFVACSGAVIDNIRDVDSKVQYPHGLPIDRQVQITQVDKYQLDPSQYVRYISLTAGGNNANFPGILEYCILTHLSGPSPCLNKAKQLDEYDPSTGTYGVLNTLHVELRSLYQRLLEAAPDADIFVLDYPRLFNTGDGIDGCLINPQARSKLDELESKVDATIKSAATSSLPGGSRLHFVELNSGSSEFNEHNLCRPVQNQNRPWINGLKVPTVYTAHPDGRGHAWMERQLDAVMKNYLPAGHLPVH